MIHNLRFCTSNSYCVLLWGVSRILFQHSSNLLHGLTVSWHKAPCCHDTSKYNDITGITRFNFHVLFSYGHSTDRGHFDLRAIQLQCNQKFTFDITVCLAWLDHKVLSASASYMYKWGHVHFGDRYPLTNLICISVTKVYVNRHSFFSCLKIILKTNGCVWERERARTGVRANRR